MRRAGYAFVGVVLATITACGCAASARERTRPRTAVGPGLSTHAAPCTTKRATASDVGLPIHAGAIPSRQDTAPDLGFWGAPWGVNESSSASIECRSDQAGYRAAVLKLETSESVERVAAFYRDALAIYGRVLDCSADANLTGQRNTSSDDETCATGLGGKPPRLEPGERLFRAGTERSHRLVGIQPHGSGARFQLVYFESLAVGRRR